MSLAIVLVAFTAVVVFVTVIAIIQMAAAIHIAFYLLVGSGGRSGSRPCLFMTSAVHTTIGRLREGRASQHSKCQGENDCFVHRVWFFKEEK
jgi:hypothetical protein